jgi:large subunit ribosomal protein L16
MLLQPRKTKYKKSRKGRIQNYDMSAKSLNYGFIGLVAAEAAYLKASQLEAARQTINRHLKRKGKVWTCIFPDLGVTKKPIQVRMGKGCGSVKYWAYRLRPGRILFEVDGVDIESAVTALKSGASKLPLELKLHTRI